MADLDLLDLTIGLVGGLALFLLGIQQLTRALQNVASSRLRELLVKLSGTRLRGAVSGTLASGMIQSSTATVVLIVGFVAAGAMPLSAAVAVVLGANLGTTITIQIIAFDITRFALLMIAVGFTVSSVKRLEILRSPARTLLGLGLIFFGIDVMAGAVAPLRDLPEIVELLGSTTSIAVALLAGALFTALVQSSSATSGVVVVLASQGLIGLEVGIAVLLGASMGTFLTPFIAGLGTSRSGLRVAVAHTTVNVLGVSVAVWLIPQLAELATWISPSHPELTGTARAAAETPRQLANAYTLFKLGLMVVFLPWTTHLARLLERLVPEREEAERLGARYLDDDVLDTPDAALALSRRELAHLGEEVIAAVEAAMPAVLVGSEEDLAWFEVRDERIDAIHDDLLRYLHHIGQHELSDEQGGELMRTLSIANDLEAIGDIVESTLAQVGYRRLQDGVVPSGPTTAAVSRFHRAVTERLRQVVDAIDSDDLALAREVVEAKPDIEEQHLRVGRHLMGRLRTDAPNRIRSYEREVEVVSHLQRIAGLTRHIARMLTSAPPRPTEA